MNIIKSLYFNPLVNKLNKNLKIRQKAYLAFLFMIILFVGFAFHQLNQIEHSKRLTREKSHYITLKQNLSQAEQFIRQEQILLISSMKVNKTLSIHEQNQLNISNLITQLQPQKTTNNRLDIKKIRTQLQDFKQHSSTLVDRYITILQGAGQKTNSQNEEQHRMLVDEFQNESKPLLTTLEKAQHDANTKLQKIAQKENDLNQNASLIIFLFIGGGIVAAVVIANFVAMRITAPVEKLEKNIEVLSNGNYDFNENFEIIDNDEVGKMVKKAEKLGETLKNTILFADQIGKNNFNTNIDISDKGELGKALNRMRDNLQEVTKQNEQRRREEEKRNWIMEKNAKVVDVLHHQYEDLDNLYYDIIKTLIESIEAVQGGLFIIEEKEDRKVLRQKAHYAYNRRKITSNEVEIGDGLLGTCAIEKEKIVLTEIPENYLNITSGLGLAEPRFIIIVPLILNDEIFGVFEIASFRELKEHEIEFLDKAAENIASTVSSAQINEKTQRLLEQTRTQAEELSAQEEEMRQNMEELQATQEESTRREKESDKILKETIEREKKLKHQLDEAYKKIEELQHTYYSN